jgi:transposase InsO family protein
VPQTNDYREIKERCRDPAQESYESIRPLVLFEEGSAKSRARETGHTPRTIRRRVALFLQEGMQGLLEQRKRHRGEIPPEIRERIYELLDLYRGFGFKELSRILFKEFGELLHWKRIRQLLEGRRPKLRQPPLPYRRHKDPRQARLEVIRLHYSGWSPTSISGFMGISRRHVYRLVDRFHEEQFAGMATHSSAPRRPARKVNFLIMTMIYRLQLEYPGAGRFNIWALLRLRAKELGLPEPNVSERTVGYCMAVNREIHPELARPAKEKYEATAHLPYRPRHLHDIWCIDMRHIDTKLDGKTLYSICVLEAHSRAILAGAVSLSKATWAILRVLYSAVLNFGRPDVIVSDNEQQFKSKLFQEVLDALDIDHRLIDPGLSWENLIEAFFGVQRRLADFKFTKCRVLEDFQRTHAEFLETYGRREHFGLIEEKREKTIPIEALGPLKCRPLPEMELERIFGRALFARRSDRYGYVRFQNWSFYAEAGLPKRRIHLWVSEEALSVEHEEITLAEYRCRFDPTRRRLLGLESEPTILRTRFRSPQRLLFAPEVCSSIKVRKLEASPRRRRTKLPMRQLVLLFEVAG